MCILKQYLLIRGYFNLFSPKFLKLTLPSLKLDASIVKNRGFSQKSITVADNVDLERVKEYLIVVSG